MVGRARRSTPDVQSCAGAVFSTGASSAASKPSGQVVAAGTAARAACRPSPRVARPETGLPSPCRSAARPTAVVAPMSRPLLAVSVALLVARPAVRRRAYARCDDEQPRCHCTLRTAAASGSAGILSAQSLPDRIHPLDSRRHAGPALRRIAPGWSRSTSPRASSSAGSETWEDEGLYGADADAPRADSSSIAHPPPNVTGELHMGHALQLAIGDALVRWQRMQGFNALFQPGYDHAGISTQNVVEKHLAREGKRRARSSAARPSWSASGSGSHEYGGKIMAQFRRLGASLDYRRERFTMDDGYVARGACASSSTSTSKRLDLPRQPDRQLVPVPPDRRSPTSSSCTWTCDDTLTYDPLPVRGRLRARSRSRPCGRRRSSPTSPSRCTRTTSATATRSARRSIVPVVERRVPVIADERVEPDFGTGALKITPGHDPMDFEIGRDHGLPEPLTVIGPDGRMTRRGRARGARRRRRPTSAIVAWLQGARPARASASTTGTRSALCERCHSRIEPLISPQWWCSMDELKQAGDRGAARAARSLPPGVAAPLRDRLARERARLVHLAPALVGPPDPDLDVPRRPPHRARRPAPDGLRRVRLDGARARDRRARHVVLVGALAVRDARLARRHARPARASTRATSRRTAREIIRLWENRMIFAGLELLGEIPFTRRDHPLDRARARRAADVEEPRHRASTRWR